MAVYWATKEQWDFIDGMNDYKFYYCKILTSILGSVGVIMLAMVLSHIPEYIKKLFLWIGKNTLIILAIHLIVKLFLLKFGNEFIRQPYVWQPLQWIIVFLLIYLLNRFVPKLVGKSELIKSKTHHTKGVIKIEDKN
jgi:fucose 4-O-acetylase-like acetyltransferase